ncbi:amino acid binding protein [Trifolium pratense]|uniref:ACT domain-containing protein ACR n=1 Tax=Trifolium pratense TaxID=57577 RepID=A0A2K3NEI8_TRIPR|nr:amino acid binding protein [Trifolium pratense]
MSDITISTFANGGLRFHDDMMYLLFFKLSNSKALLYVTEVLCELELTIKKVKVSTTPDGKVLDLFFITDTRELLHTQKRRDDTIDKLTAILEDIFTTIDIELVGSETTVFSQASSSLPNAITDVFDLQSGTSTSDSVSIVMDNTLSPAHTLVQIMCQDHKGLLFDIMRTLKDFNIQISYGRFSKKSRGKCEIDLFIMQVDGKKIVDPSKKESLSSRLKTELLRPLKVAVVSRGPDTELLVANPVELAGKGRPLVFHDITLALKMLGLCIFSAEVGRHVIGDRECEVYRVLLDEGEGLSFPRNKIEKGVWKMLMGWE